MGWGGNYGAQPDINDQSLGGIVYMAFANHKYYPIAGFDIVHCGIN